MGSSKILMFIGVLILGGGISRFRIPEEVKGEL